MNNRGFERGLETRRAVLGADYVDRAIAGADPFSAPLQQMVTEYAWDGIWNRPGLDRKTRSLLTVAMLTALNRPNELRLHLGGALNNGASRDEIRECLLQTAIYCGMPAAVDAFRVAREVLAERDAAAGGAARGNGDAAPADAATQGDGAAKGNDAAR